MIQNPHPPVPETGSGSASAAGSVGFGFASQPSWVPKWLALLLLAFALIVDMSVRLRLLNFPLERDEGEYAYAGQFILQGIPPYEMADNMKLPGVYLAYAALMSVCGQSTAGIHLGLLAVNLATLLALFLVALRLLDLGGATVATAAYALMSLSPAYLGLAAHATHFVVLPALLGAWVLLRLKDSVCGIQCLIAGVSFGVAFVMKQPAVFFGAFGAVYLALAGAAQSRSLRTIVARLGWYSLGCLLPFGSICLWLKWAGVFPAFWFWTVTYAREYVGILPLKDGISRGCATFAVMLRAAPLLWLAAAAGVIGLFVAPRSRNARLFLASFLVLSFAAVCPGLYFRPHYFIVLLPAAALLAGFAVAWGGQWLGHRKSSPWLACLPFLAAALACVQSLYADRNVLFSLSPEMACRAVYGANPFPEAVGVARYLAEHVPADQPIAVIGSEPEIFFLARRHSSTSHIYTYPLMEPQPFAVDMQKDMIREIERRPPAYLVLAAYPASWLMLADSSHLLFNWTADYLNQNMQLVGLIQPVDLQTAQAAWGAEAMTCPVRSDCLLAIFRRLKPGEAGDRAQAAARNQLFMDRLLNGPVDEELAKYKDALRLRPEDADLHDTVGDVLAEWRQTNAAISQFQEAVRLKPELTVAHAKLARLLAGQGRVEAAVHEYQEVLKRQPNDADDHFNLGGLLLQSGQLAAAAQEFQADVRLNPNDADGHCNLGNLLLHQGSAAEALHEFQEVVRLRPADAITRNNLGLLLAASGQMEAAAEQFQLALRTMPDNPQIHASFGNFLAKTGRIDDAIVQFREALRLKPDYATAQTVLDKLLAAKSGAANAAPH